MDGVEYEGANLQFVATPYGRIRKNGSNWEFDYFLKDHLGNVRVVLEAGSASPSSSVSPISSNTATYLATMEISKAEEEELYFANLNTTRADRPYNYPDKNPLNTKLAKVPGKSRGPSIMLRVMAGDTIEISAKAFYNIDDSQQGKGIDFSSIAGAAIAALTNPVSTVIGEMQRITNDLGAVANQSTVLHPLLEENLQNNMPQPKSGINFVAYNDKFEVVEINTGMILVEDRINEIQTLAADRMVITESGFLEIFANNDAQTPVYYDNMMITMTTGPVMEVNAYYPFGMIITDLSLAALPDKKNFYKYNAKELQTESGLNWHDFGQRMQDPVIGRFMVPDRFAEKYYHLSPYQYAANNPINCIDINGDSVQVTTEAILAIHHALDKNTNVSFKVNNGMIDPASFKEQAEKSNDIVLKDLYEMSVNERTIEILVSNRETYKDAQGNTHNSEWMTPYDFNTNEIPGLETTLKKLGNPIGKSIQGNLGVTLFPGNHSLSGKRSANDNIQVILNGKGSLNHRAVGAAHEFGHVILFLRGLPHVHGQQGADDFIYKRATIVSKRLGYDH